MSRPYPDRSLEPTFLGAFMSLDLRLHAADLHNHFR